MVRFIHKYRIAQNIALLCLLASCTTLPALLCLLASCTTLPKIYINEPECYGGFAPGYSGNRSYYLDTFRHYERCYLEYDNRN